MSLAEFRDLQFMSSRIPALEALTMFIPTGHENDPALQEMITRSPSRWYQVQGGNRLVILYEGGEYDTQRFTLEKGAWDHEHCKACGKSIEPMTRCWVTQSGAYVILCDDYHSKLTTSD